MSLDFSDISSVNKIEQCIHPAVNSAIVGTSLPTKAMKRLISIAAPTRVAVLVQGPTGSGKELVAQALHRASGRSGKLVAINCAAIPSELLEAELFGFEKGSFTGADRRREGRVEMAKSGTLFLDEIGDMPSLLQAKLLRVLESGAVQRLGSSKETEIDFRLVCATHCDLRKKVEEGRFREDLYYRINSFPIAVPSLHERPSDIAPILQHFETDYLKKSPDTCAPQFSLDAIRALAKYHWPGNVRELRSIYERAIILFPGESVGSHHVSENLLQLSLPPSTSAENAPSNLNIPRTLPAIASFNISPDKSEKIDLRRYLRDIEEVLIVAVLDSLGGNVSKSAEMLGLQRTTLIEKMRKLSIKCQKKTTQKVDGASE